MTVRTPAHPALTAAPRRRPSPSVPAFGARAALPSASRGDGETRAPRGLSVSSVHISGPLAVAGPRLSRREALAEAPDDALADDPAPVDQRQPAAPGGTAGSGKGAEAAGMFTPGAGQAAAGARRGGGGGGLTPAQQHATNAIRSAEVKSQLYKVDREIPGPKKDAEEARKRLEPLESARYLAGAKEHEARQHRDETKRQWKKDEAEKRDTKESYKAYLDADAALTKATEEAAAATGGAKAAEYNAAKKDADDKERKLAEKRGEQADLQQEQQTLNAKNRKLEDGMSPAEKARAKKDRERFERDEWRQWEIDWNLEQKRQRRERRNTSRPDYRATVRAKVRREASKQKRHEDKARRLLATARNPNTHLSKKARQDMLAKAKSAARKATDAARAKLDLVTKLAWADGKITDEEGREIRALADDVKKAEALEAEIEEELKKLANAAAGAPAAPPTDPCTLPCTCNIRCDPPELCECSREPAEPADPLPPDPGRPDGGGGGGAGAPAEPDVKVPEGGSVTGEPEEEPDDVSDEKPTKPAPKRGNGIGPPPWVPTVAVPPGVVVQPPEPVVPGTRTVAPKPKPGPSFAEPPPHCADCKQALAYLGSVSGLGDQDAAECLWAALGSGSKGIADEWSSPSEAARNLGTWSKEQGWNLLRFVLEEQCRLQVPRRRSVFYAPPKKPPSDWDDDDLHAFIDGLQRWTWADCIRVRTRDASGALSGALNALEGAVLGAASAAGSVAGAVTPVDEIFDIESRIQWLVEELGSMEGTPDQLQDKLRKGALKYLIAYLSGLKSDFVIETATGIVIGVKELVCLILRAGQGDTEALGALGLILAAMAASRGVKRARARRARGKRSAGLPPKTEWRRVPTEEANASYTSKRGGYAPYRGQVREAVLQSEEGGWVRVFEERPGSLSRPEGKWGMRKRDIEGLTPEQIRDKYSLGYTPNRLVDVTYTRGMRIREGAAADVPSLGTRGGGLQREVMVGRARLGTPRRLPGSED
jgi:hypothetical protein